MDWVSVKDRLPNVMENVLVYWKNTSQGKEYYETTYYDGYDWFTLRKPWIEVIGGCPFQNHQRRKRNERTN